MTSATSASCRPELNRRSADAAHAHASVDQLPRRSHFVKRHLDWKAHETACRYVDLPEVSLLGHGANDALHRDPLAVLFSRDELFRADGPGRGQRPMPKRPHSRVIHDRHEIAGAHAGDFDAITRVRGLEVAARFDVGTGRAVIDEQGAAWPAARDHAYEMDRIAPPSIGVL